MSALDELAQSRERLRVAWATMPHPAPNSGGSAMGEIAAGLIDSVLARESDHARAGLASNGLAAVLSLAKSLVQTRLGPIARDKPVQMGMVAAAAGALLVWGRPWKYLQHGLQRGAWLRILFPLLAAKLLAPKTKTP